MYLCNLWNNIVFSKFYWSPYFQQCQFQIAYTILTIVKFIVIWINSKLNFTNLLFFFNNPKKYKLINLLHLLQYLHSKFGRSKLFSQTLQTSTRASTKFILIKIQNNVIKFYKKLVVHKLFWNSFNNFVHNKL